MSFTETVQQSGQLLDYIKNHPIDWNLAIASLVLSRSPSSEPAIRGMFGYEQSIWHHAH